MIAFTHSSGLSCSFLITNLARRTTKGSLALASIIVGTLMLTIGSVYQTCDLRSRPRGSGKMWVWFAPWLMTSHTVCAGCGQTLKIGSGFVRGSPCERTATSFALTLFTAL